ncbi:MAG: 4Fe-4S binding protein [Candidatus Omnitrophica bacterium]|nr:4Fe-4S binding protein [Candidatus Omnitrophota bacterium]
MKGKLSQWIMVWLLPLIVIGGLFVPLLGYLVIGMMLFLLVLSYFKPRYWCGNFCPRGSFLDLGLSRFSAKRPYPKIFSRPWFRWLVLTILMSFLSWRLYLTGGSPTKIGLVFVIMCLITTIIAIVLGIFTKHRAWCVICPMGLLQEQIGKCRQTSAPLDIAAADRSAAVK